MIFIFAPGIRIPGSREGQLTTPIAVHVGDSNQPGCLGGGQVGRAVLVEIAMPIRLALNPLGCHAGQGFAGLRVHGSNAPRSSGFAAYGK